MKRMATVVVLALILATVGGGLVGYAMAQSSQRGRAVYSRTEGGWTFPRALVVRCKGGAHEDSMARLHVVEYSAERVVYRCRPAGSY